MNAAIVGTGYIARVHAAALRELGVEVTAVCGRTRERAEEFGLGRAYGDLAELLDNEASTPSTSAHPTTGMRPRRWRRSSGVST